MADPRYTVTQLDVCTQGFERLRSQTEFLLVAYPRSKRLSDLRRELLDDLEACARPDDFDYDAARAAVREAFRTYGDQYQALLDYEDWRAHNRDVRKGKSEGLTAFLYVRDNGA